jgi:prepilin-type N-terminal cleavage/methylation domain-containing protein
MKRSGQRSAISRLRAATRAFTLLELLVVIGVIAAVAVFLFSGLLGSGKGASLQSGQAMVANLVTAARTKAAATGHKTRLLVHADPAAPDRYLRLVVLQVGRTQGASPGEWDTVQAVALPPGVFVVPASLAGLVADPAKWKRVSDASADLDSDLFTNQSLVYALDGDSVAQTWTGVAFTPNGTLAALGGGPPPRGALVLALGQLRTPGNYGAGQPPVQLSEIPAVRGLVLSAYGVPAMLNDRSAF